jgi:hypothetical protein
MKKAYPFTIIGENNVFDCKRLKKDSIKPDIRFHPPKKIPLTLWAIITPDDKILVDTVRGKRWETIYSMTHSYTRFPHNWKKVYYNRGFRCSKIHVTIPFKGGESWVTM